MLVTVSPICRRHCLRRPAYRAGELDDRSMIISPIVLYSVEMRSLYAP